MEKSFTKLWKVMKICAAQAMIVMIVCGVSAAHDNYAQLLDKKVTLSVKDVPLEVALKEIESVTNVRIFYSIDQLDLNEFISIEAKDETLRVVLDDLLKPHKIKYKVHKKKRAIILKKETDIAASDETSLNEFPFISAKRGQAAIITGTVLEAITQQPMAGVNIIVKGTTVGTTTDSEGKYSIQAGDDDILVFSFIGYAAFETQVSGRTIIGVEMQEDIASLEEVVVNAGYWQVTKKEQTANIARITANDIEQQPVSDPIATLQGRITGLEVTQSNGIPGSNFTVRIRGTNSIASGNDPLYIIDGVPYTSTSLSFGETSGSLFSNGTSPLNNINPGDIESIEVLKDADATAIYGSRGANGIILITTKKGATGKTKVDLNFYSGIAQVSNTVDLLNTKQYLEMRREAYANDGLTPSVAQAPDLLTWDTTRYTNWQDKLIGGTARITDGQVSIAGGNAYTQFRIGTGYRKETTVFPGENGNERASFNVSIENISSNQKFKTSFSANYSYTFSDMLSKDLTGKALSLAPNAPALYDESGKLNWEGWTPSYENPLAFLERTFEANTNNLIANTVLSYSILPKLDACANIGYTNTAYKAVTVIPISSLSPETTQVNRSVFSRSQFNNWIVEPQLNWKPQLGDGAFDFLIGTTFLDQTTDGLAQYASGFTSKALMKNIAAASSVTASTNYYTQYRYHAVFGRINYNYKSRYIVNITGRRDGSSRFGPGKQFAFFKAVGLAWIFSNEPLIENVLPFLSFGKLRGSYGTTGNDQIGDYQFLDTYAISSEYQDIVGLTPSRLNNPDFAWEENKKLELGIELGAFDDRVLLSLSYYRNRSSSQLVGQPLAPTTGFSRIQANFPATIQNKGLEIELNTQNIQTRDFTWTTSFNLTIPRNELVEFPDIESFPAYDQKYIVGEPLTISKRYHYTGIDPATGYHTVEDANEDGNYTIDDRQIAGFIGRNFYGGLQSSVKYKGLQLDVFLQYVNQDGYNYTRAFTSAPGMLSNQPTLVLQRVQELSDSAPVQRFTTTGTGANSYLNLYSVSDAVIGDASFFRVKNISLSYTLPSAWLQKFNLTNTQVFIQGQNLLTFTDYIGLNPENPGSTVLPSLRTMTAGIHLTF